ncbi:MAG TPA: LytTR family DNA-binding domain-containing protein [Blastocatellia bacterium]|jgi:two-component system LytT family response regulator|nr:LytTR family DNA-binding domain-containing protein [Blastocatellia bacterium]
MIKIRVVIVDDENPARRKVGRFLAAEEDFEVAGEAGTGLEAVRLIEAQRPDLVFLDVQMPGLDGFGVIESLKVRPLPEVIFITAFDHFALKAFEVHALDYLIKPFDQPRFQKVLDHVRRQIQRGDRSAHSDLAEKLSHLLEDLNNRPKYTERLLINAGEKAFLLPVEKIDWIEAARNYVNMHVGRDSYMLRGTIEGLYQKLDPSKFLRANRSQIVNVESIRELHHWFHGEYRIILNDGTELPWSRRYLDRNSNLFLKLG